MSEPVLIRNANPRIKRVLAMLIDHFIMCFGLLPLMIIFFWIFNHIQKDDETLGFTVFSFFIIIYFNKDFYRGKSIAKRLIGYQVINATTGKTANELQCFLRNLTIPIWPLEVMISLISPQKRLGDIIANTKVIPSDKESLKSIWPDLKNTRLKVNYIGIIATSALYFYLLKFLLGY